MEAAGRQWGIKAKEDQQPAGVLGEHELRALVHREIDGGRLRCVFGYDGSGCTSALGGAQAVSVWDAGQLVRRIAEMNFLQRGADADTRNPSLLHAALARPAAVCERPLLASASKPNLTPTPTSGAP